MGRPGGCGSQHAAVVTCVLLLVVVAGALWAGPEDRYPVPESPVDPEAPVARPLEGALGEFYPIGWSRDVKFTYLELGNIGGGCGDCPYVVVTIQNLVTDEILWRWQSDTLDPSDQKFIAAAWRQNAEEIQAQIARHAIEPLDPGAEMVMGIGNRMRALGRDCTFQVRSVTRATQIPYPYTEGSATFDLILEAELFIGAPGLGSKRIHRASFETKDRVLELGVAGALVSDTSPHAAVVVATVSLDFEHNKIVKWQIVGAYLTYNFQ